MSRCTATTSFSMDRLGVTVQCTLDDDGHDRHIDEHDRWWSTFSVPNTPTPIADLVMSDLRERDRIGRAKYGTSLQACNGRDALCDAYENALNLAHYLRQAIEARDAARKAGTR